MGSHFLVSMNDRLVQYADIFAAMGLQYLPKALLALVTLFVGFRLVRYVLLVTDRALRIQRADPSLISFLRSLINFGLKILIVITVLAMLGVQMTSFIAILGAASLAVGLSLQGSLSNLAGGVLILVFKPFKVGEEIEAQTQRGTVEHIEMFQTIVRGKDGQMIIMPNGPLSNTIIINHSRKL